MSIMGLTLQKLPDVEDRYLLLNRYGEILMGGECGCRLEQIKRDVIDSKDYIKRLVLSKRDLNRMINRIKG